MTTHARPLSSPLPAARAALLVFGCAALTAIAAQVAIPLPFTPVPLTLQTLAVFLAAALLPPAAAALSQALYLGAAAAGAPILAGGVALAAVSGATFGYLVGFAVAAAIVSWGLRRASASRARAGLAFAGGSLAVLACGSAWLGVALHVGPAQAFALGAAPFLPGEALKVLAALALWRRA